MIKINVEFTAKDAINAVQRNDIIIVIDVLRCTSTITAALANGSRDIIPVRTIKEAREIHRRNPKTLLAGERKGIKPKGFHLGNSPLEFNPTIVKGKNIILTTTNGTKTLTVTKRAQFVFIGSFLNITAVSAIALRFAKKENCGLSLVLSGTRGRFSLEDYLCAGAILEHFTFHQIDVSDAAVGSLLAFKQARDSLSNIIFQGPHAKYLKSIGLEDDVVFCCKENLYSVIPCLNENKITLFDKKS